MDSHPEDGRIREFVFKKQVEDALLVGAAFNNTSPPPVAAFKFEGAYRTVVSPKVFGDIDAWRNALVYGVPGPTVLLSPSQPPLPAPRKRTWRNWAATFPRIWDLAAYLFDHKTRETIYEPSIEELKEDFYEARRKYRTKWARRWLRLCFVVRTLHLIGGCLRTMLGSAVVFVLLCWLPAPAREALKRVLHK